MVSLDIDRSLDDLADDYLRIHQQKERLFWSIKMGLSQAHDSLKNAELELRDFLSNPKRLRQLRDWRKRPEIGARVAHKIDGWIEMLSRNCIEDARARALQAELIEAELELEKRRAQFALGYRAPRDGTHVPATSNVLANILRADSLEENRRAAWDGLCSIEQFALDSGFPEIVRLRNRLGRRLGYPDFYEWRAQWAEGFGKTEIFAILDELVARTTETARLELDALTAREGERALHPWNYSFLTAGSLAAERDPYFRFEDALERWGRSFAALGIRYRGAEITVDLIDREGKYENGFMHGPTPAFFRRGQWQPAEINFAANAVPGQVGAGHVAMTTLFHEGGHAAHFANILCDAPCFSQEFAPTSVAFSETQSMLLDSLVDDADWQSRYATDESGCAIPFELQERDIRMRQPAAASSVRRMLTVCYFERELYELADEELSAQRILDIARRVESDLSLLREGSPRPMLAVPHLLSYESSAYYHGYVLAQVALDQTKEYFLEKYGHIVDNPQVGAALGECYWAPGNSINFLDYVRRMTGRPLDADALIRRITRSPDDAVAEARAAIDRLAAIPVFEGKVDLDCRLQIVHGPSLMASTDMPFEEACKLYRKWIEESYA
jgi:hypothetical protein